ncbi:MAG: XRE family transcriptional regulator [Clostridia bacterium]|nr:MAG: XRE family transcriptional regulator [Clostridia bacterium]
MITALRLARMKTGKTLRSFANENHFSEVMLSRIERGQAYVPPNWREKLAQALGVRVEDICDPVTGWPRLAG